MGIYQGWICKYSSMYENPPHLKTFISIIHSSEGQRAASVNQRDVRFKAGRMQLNLCSMAEGEVCAFVWSKATLCRHPTFPFSMQYRNTVGKKKQGLELGGWGGWGGERETPNQ